MSEFFSFNLLGFIGTITGVLALLITYRTYAKQKPNLKIKNAECKHNYTVSASQIRHINFWAKFQVHNIGDKGTRINDIVLSFTNSGEKHDLHKKYFRGLANEAESIWVEAHDTKEINADFYEDFQGNEQNRINCIFTILDTHKSYFTKTVSEKHEKRPLN
jgi:hypothetical protein